MYRKSDESRLDISLRINVTAYLYHALDFEAEEAGVSLSALVRDVLWNWLSGDAVAPTQRHKRKRPRAAEVEARVERLLGEEL